MKNQFMKRLFVFIVASLFVTLGFTQDLVKAPVWEVSHSPQNVQLGEEVELIIKATFEEGWHLYGSQFECDPIKTSFQWEVQGAEVVGDLTSEKAVKQFEKWFDCYSTVFEKEGEFIQKFKVTSEKVAIKGVYECQLCKEQCLNFEGEVEYSFTVNKEKPSVKVGDSVKPKIITEPLSKKIDQVNVPVVDSSSEEVVDSVVLAQADTLTKITSTSKTGLCSRKAGWDDVLVNRFNGEEIKQDGFGDLFLFLLGAFLSGLVALLTPCVFPMIPMTVTFFTKSSKTKAQGITNALLYGFFIIGIYTLIGVVVSKVAGPSFATEMATNWIINMVFFAIFVVFSLSFLGLFEITLPNSFINKVDSNSEKGGFIGVFFMAFTIVLVSFSCTGPIVSSILVFSADGQWLKPIVGMFGYSLAFALPFGLFAAFPGWLNSLPKSGGWLNEVKVTLGLLELAFALKFLSQADQVENWRILDREVFLSMWIAIFFSVGLYLLGKIRMKSDSPISNIGVFRMLLVLVTFSFSVYMLPGLWGAPLKSLSGMLPPMSTQDFKLGEASKGGNLCSEPRYGDQLDLPHGLKGYYDLREAICCARELKKPIFVDYTGKACANCREMESSVWSDQRVLRRLKEDYVVVALYGDYNKIELPEGEWYTNDQGKLIKTLGKSNSDLLLSKFGRQGQPFYLTLGLNERESKNGVIALNELTEAREFNKDIEAYIEFLDEGKKAYQELQQK